MSPIFHKSSHLRQITSADQQRGAGVRAARVGEERGGGGDVVREEVLRQAEVDDVNQLRRRHARYGGRGVARAALGLRKRRVGAGLHGAGRKHQTAKGENKSKVEDAGEADAEARHGPGLGERRRVHEG